MNNSQASAMALVGRILLSGIFLMAGATKLFAWSETADSMRNEGMVAVPLFLAAAIFVEIAGGLAVLLGVASRTGATMLLLFLVPVTLIFHDFWAYQGEAMQNQMQHFFKNLTIMGGLAMVAAFGPGRFSLGRARWTFAERREFAPVGR